MIDTKPAAPRPPAPTPVYRPNLGRVIAVSSGKGGVGKSTVAVNLAVSLARSGARVGLMDADIYGPNLPLMLGVNSPPPVVDQKIIPLEAHGVKVISLGFLIDKDQPAIWRGPIVMKIIGQFLGDVDWGTLDYFIVDMPPGTGDAQLSLVQSTSVHAAIIVTTPQQVATGDALRGVKMFQRVERAGAGHRREHELLRVPALREAIVDLRRGWRRAAGTGGGTATARADPARSPDRRGRRHRPPARRGGARVERREGTGGVVGAGRDGDGSGDRTGVTSAQTQQASVTARPPDDNLAAALPLDTYDGGVPVAVIGSRAVLGVVADPLTRVIWRIGAPAVASNLLMIVFASADAFWVGTRLGPEALAAVATSLFWIWLVVSIAEMVGIGLTAVAARRHGEQGRGGRACGRRGDRLRRRPRGRRRRLGRALLPWLLDALHNPAGVQALGARYLGTYLMGMPLIFGFFAVDAAFRASGDTRTPMILWRPS